MSAITQALNGVGSVRVLSLIAVGVVLLVVLTALSFNLAAPVMSPLYSGLSAEDSGQVVTELGAMGVDFKVGAGGNEILVKSSEVLGVRMRLAQKGLPSQGSIVGYEVFDKENTFGTSSFVNNVNLIRALEGELGRTIGALSTIRSARVHLVIPKREIFQKHRVEPTASVVLTLNNLTDVPKEEAVAVKHLVSSAVPGLRASRVTIVDNRGNILARGVGEEEGSLLGGGGGAEDYKLSFENRTKETVERMLEKVVGLDKVKAQVTADLAFDRITTNSETYDPDGQVARSVQSTSEIANSSDTNGGAVSVANNLPGGNAASGESGSASTTERTDETTNYEISKTITSKVSEVGEINRISIAVLVDGRYEVDEETGDKTYIPRTDQELEQLQTLVQSAIGFDAERGDTISVVNMQFSDDTAHYIVEEGPFDWLKRDLDSIIKTMMVGIVAILVILLVIRPLVNKAFDVSPNEGTAQTGSGNEDSGGMAAAAMASSAMEMQGSGDDDKIEIDMIQSRVNANPARKINDLIDNNPEQTLAVIRNWLGS